MKKQRRPQRQNPSQHIKFLTDLELHTEPIFAAAIQEAQLTGNGTWLAQVIQEQMPSIQQYMMELELENQKAEADPFYPRPTIEEFSGDVPIALIPDEFEEQPGAFVMNIGDFIKHMFICGSPGSGKSRGILAIIATLKTLMGDKLSIWVFEPAMSFRQFLYPNFEVLTFQDMRDDLFRPPTEKVPDYVWRRIVSEIMGTEQQFKIASKTQLIYTLVEFEKKNILYPTTKQILDQCKIDVKDAGSFRESDPIQSLVNRFIGLWEYDSHSRKVHIPIEDLMNMDVVFEIGDANAENDRFRSALLLSRLYHYKKHHHPDHFNLIIMDEGRELFSQTTTGFGESETERMFALARKMNIGFIVATQEPKSVSTTIKANVNTMIAFPLSDGKERMDVAMSLSLNPNQIQAYQQLSAKGHGHAIVKYAGIANPFPVQFPYVPDPDRKVTQEEINDHNDVFLGKYQIPDKPPKPKAPPKPAPLISEDEEKMLRTIYNNPMAAVTEMYDMSGIEPSHCSGIKDKLIDNKYLDEELVKAKAGIRALKFVRLTPLACKKLGLKARPESGPGIKHEIYARLVKKQLEDNGWRCEFEVHVNGSRHPMDVYAIKDGQRHDYEITIHFDNIQDNINNALEGKLADKVVIVADDIEKCMTLTTDEQKKYGDALEFQPISDFYL